MIWLAALLTIGQPTDDCSPAHDDDFQPCEYQRHRQADILDAARRPGARGLGANVIRFSRSPSLGGRGFIIEIVEDGGGGGEVSVYTLSGGPRGSWQLGGTRRFALSADRFRRLASAVDSAIANRVQPPPEQERQETRIVCTDGPGWLTERVTNGVASHLRGSCPPNSSDPHPNAVVATLIRDMLCLHRDPAADPRYWSGRRCYTPPFTMRGP